MKILLLGAALAATLTLSTQQDAADIRSRMSYTPDTIAALEVSDLEASTTWYREVLGFEVFLDLSEMGWVEVTTPTEKALIGLGQVQPGETLKTNGGSKIGFGTTDIERARAWLVKNGVEAGEINVIPGVVKLMDFQDPDGNNLMLHQAVEAD